MTATPGSAALLALADEIEASDGLYRLDSKLGEHQGYQLGIKKTAQVVAALRLAAKPAEDVREALIRISDGDWQWKGGGSDIRYRGPYGKIAAKALGIPQQLPLGWPDHTQSETEKALRSLSTPGQPKS